MAERDVDPANIPVVTDQPLIGVPSDQDGREVTRYFAHEDAADAATRDADVQQALRLAGVWHDLDWQEMAEALDHIRHESEPSPPIAL